MATTYASAVPTAVVSDGINPTFRVSYTAVAGDGVSPPVEFGGCSIYDPTQTPATNLVTLKASVALGAQSSGITVDVSNILVFTAVN